jgi:hypothetical protein
MTPNGVPRRGREPSSGREPPARLSLRFAAGLVWLEGGSGVVAGVGFVLAALTGHPSDRGVAVGLGVLLSFYGAAVVFVGFGVWRGGRWARTPAYLVQFFGLVVAWYQRSSLPAVAITLGVVSVATIAALLRQTPADGD